jgi:hypothetical protein
LSSLNCQLKNPHLTEQKDIVIFTKRTFQMTDEGGERKIFMDHLLRITIDLLLASSHFLCLSSLPKSILEPSSQSLHVSHTSCSYSSATLGLFAPVEIPHLFGRVPAARACLLLDVVGNFTAATASRVGLVVPFSE